MITNILLKCSVISVEQAPALAPAIKGMSWRDAVDYLEKKHIATDVEIAKKLAQYYSRPFIAISTLPLEPDIVTRLPQEFCDENLCILIDKDEKKYTLAISNPLDFSVVDKVEAQLKSQVLVVISSIGEVCKAIQRYYNLNNIVSEAIKSLNIEEEASVVAVSENSEKINLQDLEAAPIVRLVNLIITCAIDRGASDIHLEPDEKCLNVRIRVDGILQHVYNIQKWMQSSIISRIKVLAGMDIATRGRPQDGHIRTYFKNRQIDMRASCLPSQFGEKVVLRIIGQGNKGNIDLVNLGLTPQGLALLQRRIRDPQGMILATGPTGSGKSSTLNACLREVNRPDVNIITIEDPIEFPLPGATQVQVNEKAGNTFLNILRAVLRQDPNIILVGEIRDAETAKIAMELSITGHLVLSTLHTNDSVSTIVRFIHLGIDRFMIGSALSVIISQRLMRKNCLGCKQIYIPPSDLMDRLGLDKKLQYYKGMGCHLCDSSGYKGRVGVYEMLEMDERMQQLLLKEGPMEEIFEMGKKSLLISLQQASLQKVKEGFSTPEEALRCVSFTETGKALCRKCKKKIEKEFMICPYCKQIQKNTCKNCGRDMKLDWTVCPYCAGDGNANAPAIPRMPPVLLPGLNTSQPIGSQAIVGTTPSQRTSHYPIIRNTKRYKLQELGQLDIYMAEPDKQTFRLVSILLKSFCEGITMAQLKTGGEALQKIREKKPHLMLTEWELPDMGCENLLQEVDKILLDIDVTKERADSSASNQGDAADTTRQQADVARQQADLVKEYRFPIVIYTDKAEPAGWPIPKETYWLSKKTSPKDFEIYIMRILRKHYGIGPDQTFARRL